MIDGITYDDAASGEYDDELTLAEVKRDVEENWPDYYCCWIDGEHRAIEVGQNDDSLEEKPVITDKASAVYTWMGI